MTLEVKEKISEGMKRAHKERRAFCWSGRLVESYPEKWWSQVIENEFNDKNYLKQMSFYLYSLDFAWPEKQRCIEIDGKQHEYGYLKESDFRKDQKLYEEGWEVLRIKWTDTFRDPKQSVEIAKNFIDTGKIIPFEKRWKTTRERWKEKMEEKYGSIRSIENRCYLSNEEILKRKEWIEEFDHKKFGWKNNCSKKYGLSPRQIEKTCDILKIEYRTKMK